MQVSPWLWLAAVLLALLVATLYTHLSEKAQKDRGVFAPIVQVVGTSNRTRVAGEHEPRRSAEPPAPKAAASSTDGPALVRQSPSIAAPGAAPQQPAADPRRAAAPDEAAAVRRGFPLPWPPPLIGAKVHTALQRYGEWHTRESARLFGSRRLQAQLMEQVARPTPHAVPPELPRVLVSDLGGQGLGGSTINGVDLFLLALLTRRLFFVTSQSALKWGKWMASPYFNWTEPRLAPLVAAFNRHSGRKGYPFFSAGWSCNKWPLRLKDEDLAAVFPAAVYVYNDGNKGHPWTPWLMANRHHKARLEELGLVDMQLEVVHGILQTAVFQPGAPVLPALNRVVGRLTAPVTIGVHFRTSGNPQWRDPSRLGPSHIQCHFQCALHLLDALRREGRAAQVYVAADRVLERTRAQALFGRYGAGVLVMQNLTAEIAHVAKSRASDASILECLVDFFALGRCNRYVITKSSFSVLASFRSGTPYIVNPFPKAHGDNSKCHGIEGWCSKYPTEWNRKFFFFGHKTGCRQRRQPPLLPNTTYF